MRCPICGEHIDKIKVYFNVVENTYIKADIDIDREDVISPPSERSTTYISDFTVVCPVCSSILQVKDDELINKIERLLLRRNNYEK